MSTYFGYSYRLPKDEALKVFVFLQELKKTLEREYYNRTIETICEAFEEHARAGKPLDFKQYKSEIHSRAKHSRLYKGNPESGLRYHFDSKYLYLKFWGDDDVLTDALDAFEKKFKPKSFNWWNSTDRPSNISAREWSARKKKWDEILNGRWDFGHLPYLELVPDYIEKEDIPHYLYWANTSHENFLEVFRKEQRETKNKY